MEKRKELLRDKDEKPKKPKKKKKKVLPKDQTDLNLVGTTATEEAEKSGKNQDGANKTDEKQLGAGANARHFI